MIDFIKSFAYAFRGIFKAVKEERNMRIHICVAAFVIFFSFVCSIEPYEWIAVILCIGSVISAEAKNSAIETALDRIGTEQNELTKKSKDAAAGAVLVSAIASAVIGGIIFFSKEKISTAYEFFSTNIWAFIIFVIAVILSVIFIATAKKERKQK